MRKVILILIIVLAFVLRFYKLNTVPALNADEAAIGYNAYSLLQTGMDEHGNAWPIHFQSFNDYKPGLYFYLVLPFIKLFGMNDWAVRIPGAGLGGLTVLTVYYLVIELFGNKLQTLINYSTSKESDVSPSAGSGFTLPPFEVFGLITTLFLAISPWHIHFSRGGWEVNAATFFITAGVLFFLKGFKNNKQSLLLCSKLWVMSCGLWVASLYTYHAARVITPLLVLGLGVIYFNQVKKNWKAVIVAGLIGLVMLIPLAHDFAKGQVLSRAAGVGLFADPGPLNRINEQRGEHTDYISLIPKLFHNKAVNYGLVFMANWAKHYHGEFLFLSGDEIQRDKVPETGIMYLFDFIFLIAGVIGIIKLLQRKETEPDVKRGWYLILYWLAIAPLASALTFQSPSALRTHNMVIPLVIISSFGLISLIRLIGCINKSVFRTTFYILLSTYVLWNFSRYLHEYYVHMAKDYPYSSQYGVKELVGYVNSVQDKYQKIIVTNRYDQPYILFLFYLQYPPQVFQKQHVLTTPDNFGYSTVSHFDKYYFQSIKFDTTKPENPNSLIIGTGQEIPKEANVVKKIYGTNGFLYFDAVAN